MGNACVTPGGVERLNAEVSAPNISRWIYSTEGEPFREETLTDYGSYRVVSGEGRRFYVESCRSRSRGTLPGILVG
jgi:hypothetical protein